VTLSSALSCQDQYVQQAIAAMHHNCSNSIA
jgi:hypothetical protein